MEDKEVLYAKWLSGEISDQELQELEGAQALEDVRRVVSVVDQWSMPAYDTSAGYERLREKRNLDRSSGKRRNILLLIITLIGAVLLIAFLARSFMDSSKQVLFAAHGENLSRELPDGSRVILNDGSTVSYTAEDWSDDRILDLTGEAYFDVTKGSQFTVQTIHGEVRVLGTQFNVKAWGENLYVECYEGRVQVSANDQETIVVVGESVFVRNGIMGENQIMRDDRPAWQDSNSRFINEELNDVFDEIERQYGVTIESNLARREFSGGFGHDDLDSALKSICKPLGLKYVVKDNKVTIIE